MDGWLSPYPKVNVERHPCVHEAGMPTGGRQAVGTLLYQAVRLQGHFDMIEKFEGNVILGLTAHNLATDHVIKHVRKLGCTSNYPAQGPNFHPTTTILPQWAE